nr:uncharacterized protein LOC113823951 [Penaeus vannamei]
MLDSDYSMVKSEIDTKCYSDALMVRSDSDTKYYSDALRVKSENDTKSYKVDIPMHRNKCLHTLLDMFICRIGDRVAAAFASSTTPWYHTDHMHFHITKAYAHLGHLDAQATVGHKLLMGKGVEKNHTAAMEWFKKASDQGHPHAAYNLAVGHLQGYKIGLKPGDAHELIKKAAEKGVPEAIDVLDKVCSRGHCDA